MNSYLIKINDALNAAIFVAGGIVIKADPVLRWTIERQWEEVRDHCSSRGWQIIPDLEPSLPQWIELDHTTYELHWQGLILQRVTRYNGGEGEDLRYEQLPTILKELI